MQLMVMSFVRLQLFILLSYLPTYLSLYKCDTKTKHAVHGLWRSAGCNMLFRRAVLARQVGHIGLVLCVLSGFFSGSVHARLQVSVCNGYDLCHPG